MSERSSDDSQGQDSGQQSGGDNGGQDSGDQSQPSQGGEVNVNVDNGGDKS